ncbi:MAG: transposase [Verrucomicrobiota bacterium]|nr:transposase [Verrucomicrobiota bacterium]
MLRMQAFKYELQPNGEQERDMRRISGACRFVFNKALAIQRENHEAEKPFISYVAMAKQLTVWRNSAETPWLKEAPCHPLQHALKDLDRAYKNFFAKRADFPRFKRKGNSSGFRYPDPMQIKLDQVNSRIFLPKLGWIRYRKSREITGELCNVTVTCNGKKWFVSIQTEREVGLPKRTATTAVGIDVGIARFATLNDGTYIAPLNSFKKHQKRLAHRQRELSRKVKFSNNWKKAKAKVQEVHIDIGNARKDFLHKATTTISKNHALVCVEDLQVKAMSKTAAGTKEQPGKQVRQKSNLNRNILDQGWGMFRSQLEYKLGWSGGILLAVPSENTSRSCPDCEHISEYNRKTQSQFECIRCGYKNNADVVGAMNVLERGYRLLACGEMAHLDRSKKQEPTEVSQLTF